MATLTIPDKLYERLQALAAGQQRSVDEFMIEMIENVAPDNARNSAPLTREEETRRLREAMTGIIMSEAEVAKLLPWLDDDPMTEDEIDEILANLPVLDPPLSQIIIQMRDEERY